MRNRKRKWKKILLWTASIVLLVGIGGLFAANYVVDRLIASLADSLESELINDQTAKVDNPSSAVKTPEASSEPNIGGTDSTITEPSEEPDKGVGGGSNTGKPKDTTEGYAAEVSVDKAKDVQDKITVGEKAKVTSTLLKELSMSDIKQLQELASGGLSLEEKKEARSLILERLTEEQYDELIEIAKKYGLSQGKSYAEVSGK